MDRSKVLTASGYQVDPVFYRGVDRRAVASGGSLIWSVTIPDTNMNTLLSRDLRSFSGGGIPYSVYLKGTTTVLGAYSDILIPANSSSGVKFRRVASWTAGNAVLTDIDEIPENGAANGSTGGAAGGQSFRTQPNGVEFILVAENPNTGSRTITLALGWVEGDKYLYKDR